ncbi:hypothetical protein ACLMAB_01390 [Brevibacillus laterosporus]
MFMFGMFLLALLTYL